MFELVVTDSYEKRAKKFFGKRKNLLNKYEKMLQILVKNPNHPSLRLHKLEGQLKGLFSVSITLSYRVTLYFILSEHQIVLVDIGSHDEVY